MKFISKRLKTHNVQKQVETVASSQILTLHFVVLSFDRYSRDDVVGEVMGELEGIFSYGFFQGHGGVGGDGPLLLWDLPPLTGQGDHPEERQAEKPGEGRAPCLSMSPGDLFSEAALIKVKMPYYWVNLIQPAASRVTVVVLKARNLPKMDITGLSGLNIHSYFITGGRSMLTTMNIFYHMTLVCLA